MGRMTKAEAVRQEMLVIDRALARVEEKLDRLFPAASGWPGEGCILRETVIGVGQARSYITGFYEASEDHINQLIAEFGPAAQRASKEGRAALALSSKDETNG